MSEVQDIKKLDIDMLGKIVDDSSNAIIIRDIETYEVLYMNKKASELPGIGNERTNGKCYEYLRNSDKPCENCPAAKLRFDKYYEEIFESKRSGQYYHIRGKLIEWNGKTVLLEFVSDETMSYREHQEMHNLINNIPGGVGIYNVHKNGEIEQIYLNDGYYSMIDTVRNERQPYMGYSVLNAVHEDDREKVKEEAVLAIKENRNINVDFRTLTGKGDYRWINICARIALKTDEKCVMYAIYSDIDKMKKMQIQLENSQMAIELAKKRGDISIWTYDIDDKILSQSFFQKGAMGYPIQIKNVPEFFIKNNDIHSDDIEKFRTLYKKVENGELPSEATIRLMNRETGKFDWVRMIYERIDNQDNKRITFGFSVKVNLQQEHLERYEAEKQLRRKLFGNSVLYYQVNLTKSRVEEYKSYDESEDVRNVFDINENTDREILENVKPEHRQQVADTLFTKALKEKFMNGETAAEIEYRRKLGSSEYHWVSGTAVLMTKPDSTDMMAFVYIQNIDAEKKEELAKNSVTDEEIESIILYNIKEKTVDIIMDTEEWAKRDDRANFKRSDKFINNMLENIIEEDRERCREFINPVNVIKELEEKNILRITYITKDKNGKIHRKKVRVMYLDENHEDIVFARRDITDLYEEEQRQKRILENAIDEANAANQAKSEFLSRMSHDIRTPLNAVISLSGEELTNGADEEQIRKYLEKINDSGKYLLGIINDILDMSKIESQKMVLNPEPYTVNEFIDTIKVVIDEQCRAKGLKFVINRENVLYENVMLDKVRFNQIFINLLSNAVKFTPAGGKVELILRHISNEKDKVKKQFIVRDNGIGMSEKFLPHAFESFAQEIRSDTPKNIQGTGLGLSIVYQLVELMGGTIEVKSRVGKGTEFIITMVLDTVLGDAGISHKKSAEINLEGVRVLLCEDHPLNIQIAKMLLEKKHCVVDVAENGKEGLEKFEKSATNFYDLILMDIRMPIMDGLEATKKIRLLKRTDAQEIPIVAMTANAFAEDAQISLNAGMTDHITKPIDTNLLYEKVALYSRRS